MDCKLDDSRTVPGVRCMSLVMVQIGHHRWGEEWVCGKKGGREGGKVGEMEILITENQREF